MALINCEECNKEISDKADSCPHCGCPISNVRYQVKSEYYTIKIYDTREKVKAIKVVREVTGIGLKEAKDLVDSNSRILPCKFNSQDAITVARTFINNSLQIEIRNDNNVQVDLNLNRLESKGNSYNTVYNHNSIEFTPRCPKCNSSDFEMVRRNWSVFTGFMTNKVDRVCLNCKNKFP